MAQMQFFEKPGCGGNAKQKAWLQEAGFTLAVHNLLTWPWTPATLDPFLKTLPVVAWFNRAAPRIKSGEIVPEQLSAEEAMALLIAEPILIRRPLMQWPDGRHSVGFDPEIVQLLAQHFAPAPGEGCASSSEPCHSHADSHP